MACWGDERHAGIEPNIRVLCDQRIVGKSWIVHGIRHNEDVGLVNRMGAKGDVAGCLRRVDSHLRFEPLTMCID